MLYSKVMESESLGILIENPFNNGNVQTVQVLRLGTLCCIKVETPLCLMFISHHFMLFSRRFSQRKRPIGLNNRKRTQACSMLKSLANRAEDETDIIRSSWPVTDQDYFIIFSVCILQYDLEMFIKAQTECEPLSC